MATVATQSMNLTGAALTYSSASGGGDRFTPARHTFMHVKNASGSSLTVTVVTPGTVDGLAIADRAVVITNGSDSMIPLPAADYGTVADGNGDVSWSTATSVTFAVIYAPAP